MLDRLKKLIKLSKKDQKAIDNLFEKIDELPDENTKAVFLSSGTEKEFREQEREDKGLKGIFGL